MWKEKGENSRKPVLFLSLRSRVFDGGATTAVDVCVCVQRWQQLHEERPLNSFSLPLIQPLTADLQGQPAPPPHPHPSRLSHISVFKPPLFSHLFCFNLSLAIAPGGGVTLEGGVGFALWPWWVMGTARGGVGRGYKSPTHTYNCQRRSGCPRAPVATVTLDGRTHAKVHECRDETGVNREDLCTCGAVAQIFVFGVGGGCFC